MLSSTSFVPVDPTSNHIINLADSLPRSLYLEPFPMLPSAGVTGPAVCFQTSASKLDVDEPLRPLYVGSRARRTQSIRGRRVRVVPKHLHIAPTLTLPLVHAALDVCSASNFQDHGLLALTSAAGVVGVGK